MAMQRFFLLGIHAGEKFLPLAAAHRVGEGDLFSRSTSP